MTALAPFRSVNLQDDLAIPERLAHYHPTSRSAPVVGAVLEGRATLVMAAYGSGKSLAAGVGCMLVRNADRDACASIAERLKATDPALGAAAAERAESGAEGRVVILSGHVRDVPGALCDALGLPRKRTIEPVLQALSRMTDADRVAIVWDEFGRHLEGIVNEGRARDLHVVQRLAEWADRAREPSASLTLLLHQNLLAYGTALNQTSRNEWRKVEGRFEQIRFVEDSQELYELAARLIAQRRHEGLKPPAAAVLRASARRVREAGWFDGLDDLKRLETLLRNSYPLTPAALQVLPRLVARVGQNERSLFAFLESADLSSPLGMEEVYLAFSDAMRSDVAIGGAHRRWVETGTARSRAESDAEREALAAACLLQLGVDGERHRLTVGALETAVASRGYGDAASAEAVQNLIRRKLLLHRKLNDDVSIWHGADLDIPGRIREERARRSEGFDLKLFLAEQHPAPHVRPTRHNLEFGTARYLQGRYVTAAEIALVSGRLPESQGDDEWGSVFFVLAETAEELREARRKVEAGWPGWGRALVALPTEPLAIEEAAREVDALLALQRDDSLRAEDPLVGEEIAELLAVGRRQLSVMLHRLTTDRPAAVEWWGNGQRIEASPDFPVGVAASALLDRAYSSTPRIINDQLMRNGISRNMDTARLRILSRIIDRGGEPQLGYRDEELSSAEGSIYRTVLESTGLHVSDGAAARFAAPAEIADPGLKAAWTALESFFSETGTKTLAEIVSLLRSPPFGIPAGVLPILVVAAMKAFGRAVSLRTDGAYVPDLLGFAASRMFLEPSKTQIEVHSTDPEHLHYLAEVAYVFSHKRPGPMQELVAFAAASLAGWRASLSDGVRRSRRHTDDGRKLLRLVAEAEDVPRLLLRELPAAFGKFERGGIYPATIRILEKARKDVDRLVDGYVRDATAVIGEVLSLEPTANPVTAVQAWVSCLDVPALLERDDVSLIDKAILRTAWDTTNGRYSAESLARAVSSVLLRRGLDRWEDGTPAEMRRLLRECRARIEDAALDAAPGQHLAPIVRARIAGLQAKLELMTMHAGPMAAAGGTR